MTKRKDAVGAADLSLFHSARPGQLMGSVKWDTDQNQALAPKEHEPCPLRRELDDLSWVGHVKLADTRRILAAQLSTILTLC